MLGRAYILFDLEVSMKRLLLSFIACCSLGLATGALADNHDESQQSCDCTQGCEQGGDHNSCHGKTSELS